MKLLLPKASSQPKSSCYHSCDTGRLNLKHTAHSQRYFTNPPQDVLAIEVHLIVLAKYGLCNTDTKLNF